MNSPANNPLLPGAATPAEETLRIIANLPAPEGLEERVHARLHAAPRTTTILRWPVALSPNGWMHSNALRGAAAAAIVCVVAGGGWRIYSRVQPSAEAQIIVLPARIGPGGGFSSAGAIRKPETLTGPVLTHAVAPESVEKPAAAPDKPVQNKKVRKSPKPAVPAR